MVRLGCLILSCILLSGCSIFFPKSEPPKKDPTLHVRFEQGGWKPTDPNTSDYAWAHETRGDVMLVNSFCGEFQSLPLESLALKTFQGYESFNPLGKHTLDWFGREAFEMEAEAKVDGVIVLIHLRNYRRNHCYYDFVMISPRREAESSLHAFENMLAGVRFL